MANLVVKKTWTQEGKQVGSIRVDVEETLGHYAEWLDVSARDIRRLNGLRYGRALQLNQKLKIPLHRVTPEGFVEKRFEYHQELAEDFLHPIVLKKYARIPSNGATISGPCPTRNLKCRCG